MNNKSCMNCGTKACQKDITDKYPEFCLTLSTDGEIKKRLTETYANTTEEDGKIAIAAAQVEAEHYGKVTRIEEIIYFARKIGAKKIGIASCVGLMSEAQTFAKILEFNDLEAYGVLCKVGAIDKGEIGICSTCRVNEGGHESLCNPILQAEILNREKTDLNVIVGLCVGHDSLFIKHSEAIVTSLITKDRVTMHNPAAPLYGIKSYYKRLLNKKLGE